jgi:hypothetical protein
MKLNFSIKDVFVILYVFFSLMHSYYAEQRYIQKMDQITSVFNNKLETVTSTFEKLFQKQETLLKLLSAHSKQDLSLSSLDLQKGYPISNSYIYKNSSP